MHLFFYKLAIIVIISGVALFVTGCKPPRPVSAECQSKINNCLQRCDSAPNENTDDPYQHSGRTINPRRTCENDCSQLCH